MGPFGVAWLCAVFVAPANANADSLGRIAVEANANADSQATVVSSPRASDSSTVTRIVLDAPTAGATSVADVLDGEAGVRVRSRGGQGSFSSVSIRGSESAEVTVLLDGVPLSRAGFGLIDLSQLPLEGLERIEIYRGVVPAELGSESIGGAINLVSRSGAAKQRTSASAGGGSFGARVAAASLDLPFASRWRSQVSVGYRGADGNFSFYDNGGTLFLRDDDGTRVRRNNGFDQVSAHASLKYVGRRFSHTLIVDGFWRRQGVPGFATLGAETKSARLDGTRLLASLRHSGAIGGVRLNVVENFALERLAFANPAGEQVGIFGPSVIESLALTGGVQASVDRRFGRHQLGRAVVDLRAEGRWPSNILAPARSGDPSGRLLYGAAIVDEAYLASDRFKLEGTVRVDGNVGGDRSTTTERVFVSPRLAMQLQVANRQVTLRASAGRFVRMPTLLELFGDGAFFLPAPSLKPEKAWGGEVGVHAEGQGSVLRGLLDLALFGRQVDDLITYVPGQNAATAINLGHARVLGAEARGEVVAWKLIRVGVHYTFLDARNLGSDADSITRGKLLPGRAPHELTAMIALTGFGTQLGYEVHYLSDVYRDERNFNRVPGYVLHELSVRYAQGPIAFAVELHNVGDLRQVALPLGGSAQAGKTTPYPLVDFFNYPLPGRAVYATVTVHN